MPPGFADEVKQVGKSESVPEPQGAEGGEADSSTSSTSGETTDFNNSLPVGEAPVTPEGEQAKAQQKAQADAQVERPAAKIKIGTKEFESASEALAYAEELEIARIQEEGFKEGYEAGKPKPEEKSEARKALEEEVEEMLWENPKEALKKLREGIQNEIRTEHRQWVEQQAKAQEQAQRVKALWDSFYTENNDLAESRDVVDYLLEKNKAELGKMEKNKALEKLAELARKQLRITKQAAAPAIVLDSKAAVVAGVSESTPTKLAPTEEENLDFVKQLASLRRRPSA